MDHDDASCVLDEADKGGLTLDQVGTLLGVTRERVRQIEALALRKLEIRHRDLSRWLRP